LELSFSIKLSLVYRKSSTIAVPWNRTSSQNREEKENTLIQIFNTTARMGCVIASLMVLEEFGVEIAPYLAAARIVGLAFGLGSILIRDYLRTLLLLENQYRVGDVVSFDNASGTVKEIIGEKQLYAISTELYITFRMVKLKKVSNLSKDFSRINLDME
jgi:small conductance mechanosensitive channel